MSATPSTSRLAHKLPALLPAARTFWESAQRVADLAAEVSSAPRSVLVEAGAKFHGHAIQSHELAADLASLNDQIQIIRKRLSDRDEQGEGLLPKSLRQNAEQSMAAMVRDGALIAPAAFAQAMSFTRQALSKALKANRVFYVEVAGERHYPDFFLDHRYQRRQIERVSQALGDLPGPSKLQFFLNPKASLEGLSPLEALAHGKYSQVHTAAEGFAER